MRAQIVFHMIKDEFHHYRWLIYSFFLIPLLLGILTGWKHDMLIDWAQSFGITTSTLFDIMSALLVFIPYTVIWITLTIRLSRDERNGYYLFSQTLPTTPTETVTAKFIVSFVLNVGSIIWFVALWLGYVHYIDDTTGTTLLGAIYLLTFFFSIWLAWHHAMFFRSGAQETWSIYFFLIIIVFLTNRSFAKRWLESVSHKLEDDPLLLIGIASVLLLTVWIACWRWAMASYARYLHGNETNERRDAS